METWEVVAVDKKAVMRFKNEGKEIAGIRLLLKGNEPANKVEDRYIGFNWHDQFISNERLAKLEVTPHPGDIVTIFFNRFGDIIKIDVA